MPRKPSISPADVEAMKRKGLNQSEIARDLGFTRQNISYIKHKVDTYSRTQREIVRENFPYVSSGKLSQSTMDRKIRDHAEYAISSGKGMSERKLKRLVHFYRKLVDENLIVEFNPEIPPGELDSFGGFAYRKRLASDEDLILRENEYVTLTDEARSIFALPDELPDGSRL